MVRLMLLILFCVRVMGLRVKDVKQDWESVVYEMQKTQQMQTMYIKNLEKRLNDQIAVTTAQAKILKVNQRKLESLEKTVAEQKELILKLLEKEDVKNVAKNQDAIKGHTAIHGLIHSANYTEQEESGHGFTNSIDSGGQEARDERVLSRPIRAAAGDTGVAFYAYMPTNEVQPGPDHTLIFRSVVTNIGNHYNQHSGIFTSPSHGVFVFSWTIAVWYYIGTELVVNSNSVGAMYTTAHGVPDIRTTTGVVVVMLNQNDVVRVRVNADSSVPHSGDIYSASHYKTSFCGWKLF